jgi:hypothetical protein
VDSVSPHPKKLKKKLSLDTISSTHFNVCTSTVELLWLHLVFRFEWRTRMFAVPFSEQSNIRTTYRCSQSTQLHRSRSRLVSLSIHSAFHSLLGHRNSRDSSFTTVTRLRAGRPGNRGSIASSCKDCSIQRLDGLYRLPRLLSSGYQGLFPPKLKRLGHETDISSADVKNAWSYTSTQYHSYTFLAWCLGTTSSLLICLVDVRTLCCF